MAVDAGQHPPATAESPPAKRGKGGPRRWAGLVAGVVFTVVEDGIESAAGVWGYVFLTAGRGVTDVVAGVAVSAYWAMMVTGPLVTLTTADRVIAADATTAVGLQVAASAVGGAVLPSAVGLIINAVDAGTLGPALFVLRLAMCGVYRLLPRSDAEVECPE